MATKKRGNLKSPIGIVRYANVFTARARKDAKGQPKGDPKFQLLLVFDKKTDISELEEAVEAVAVEKFGTKAVQMLANGKLNNPIRDASDYLDEDEDEDAQYPFNLPGAKMIRFATKDKPGVVDADAEPIMDKSDFYDGCKARVSCRVFAYDNESKGVSFALVNVQKVDDGERLSGNPTAESEFANDKPKAKAASKSKPKEDDDDPLY